MPLDAAKAASDASGAGQTHRRPDPVAVLSAQAERVRVKWRDPEQRRIGLLRIASRSASDPTNEAWSAILAGNHPFVAWLEGNEPFATLPTRLSDGSSPRQIVSSHPFVGAAWLIPPTSPKS